MDGIQWYSAGLAALIVIVEICRLSEQQTKPFIVLAGWGTLVPLFGRIFGWW